MYSTPNIVLPFLGGLLVDKLGAQQMLLALTMLVLAGQTVLAIGTSISSFRIMLVRVRERETKSGKCMDQDALLTRLWCPRILLQVGRVIFGFGGESLGVARTTFIATWFKKRELGASALGSLLCNFESSRIDAALLES